jgi:hypothetical protein
LVPAPLEECSGLNDWKGLERIVWLLKHALYSKQLETQQLVRNHGYSGVYPEAWKRETTLVLL